MQFSTETTRVGCPTCEGAYVSIALDVDTELQAISARIFCPHCGEKYGETKHHTSLRALFQNLLEVADAAFD